MAKIRTRPLDLPSTYQLDRLSILKYAVRSTGFGIWADRVFRSCYSTARRVGDG